MDALLKSEHSRITQNEIIHAGKRYFDLNADDSHELAMLGVDPYDEVNRTVSFARRHVALLNKEHFQDLIYIHLFKHGRMLSQLKDSPQSAEQMVEFLEEALDYYIKACDPKTCLYLVKIGQMMKEFARKSGCSPKNPFPNFHSIILDTLVPMMKEPGEIKQSCEMIVKWHIPSRDDGKTDPETLKRIAEAVTLTSLSARLQTQKLSETSDLGLDLVTRNTQRFWHPMIHEIMEKDQASRERILNHALRMLINGVPIGNWEGDYPNYRSGIYEINIETGIAKKNGHILVTLPDSIVRHEDFKRLKIKTISHVAQKNLSTYIIYPDEIEVSYKRPHIEIRKIIEGERYRYHSGLKELASSHPSLFDEETDFWIYDHAVINSHCRAIRKGLPSIRLNLQLKPPGYHLKSLFSVTSIEQGDREWVPLTNPELKKVLCPVESDLKYIDCWRNKNKPGSLDTISLARLGLNFIVRQDGDKSLAYCHEFPGFFISESRFVNHSLNEDDPYIVLENAAGEKKVIFPKLALSSSYALQHDTTISLKIFKVIKDFSREWMEYSIREGELHSSFVGPRLYLALLYSVKGNYAETQKLLKRLNCTTAFTKKDKEIIAMLFQNLEEDKHPAAQALLLFLYTLTEENKLKFPPSVGTKDEYFVNFGILYKTYRAYMQNVGNIPTFKLAEDQEKSFLCSVKKYIEQQLKSNSKELTPQVFREEISGYFLEEISGYLEEFNSRSSIMESTLSQKDPDKVKASQDSSIYWLKTAVEDYVPTVKSPKFLYESVLMKDSSKLKAEFIAFYDVALRGSAAERKKLIAFLDLQSGNIKGEEDKQIHDLLKMVCRYPSCYPKISSLKEALAKKNASNNWKDEKACDKLFSTIISNKSANFRAKIVSFVPGIFNLLFKMFSSLFTIPRFYEVAATLENN